MAYTTIDDGSAYHHTQLYTGNETNRTITNSANAGDFQPDLVIVKHRNHGTSHSNNWVDSTRGGTKTLYSNSSDKEETISTGITGFTSNGFTVGTNGAVNGNNFNYKAWQWVANGGTTSSNTNGSVTTTVQANTTAGFSIVKVPTTGSVLTAGHGLSQAPELIINKSIDKADYWGVYHATLGATEYTQLNTGNAFSSAAGLWNNTAPTATVFTMGTENALNNSGQETIAYLWHSVQGYCKVGKYTGNGNNDGPFVYTGFKPAWLLVRNASSNGDGWVVFDNKRDPYNGVQYYEFINNGAAEGSGTTRMDFVSNGFKLRQSGAAWNESGSEIVYLALAEHPFVSSNGVPVTAR